MVTDPGSPGGEDSNPRGGAPTYYYRPQTKLWEGNVFTCVCLSTSGGGRFGFPPCITGHMTSIPGRGLPTWWVCIGGGLPTRGGLYPGEWADIPPPELGKRAVRIILECFHIWQNICCKLHKIDRICTKRGTHFYPPSWIRHRKVNVDYINHGFLVSVLIK